MMNKYAQVIVDITAADLNQVYDYAIPDKLKGQLKIGQVVIIPFGSRKIKGFIVGFTNKPQIEKEKIKKINKLFIAKPLFDMNMLKLFKWIASYYKALLIKIIKTAIPSGLLNGQVGEKKIRYIELNQSSEETQKIIKLLMKRAPKQASVLQVLLRDKNSFIVSKLAKRADTTPGTVTRLLNKGYLKYTKKIIERRPDYFMVEQSIPNFKPTPAQVRIIELIYDGIKKSKSEIFLLHGVTGSGKTEVYLQVIEKVLKDGKGAIILVPEIALTPMMVKRFYSRFGDKIAVLHSNLSAGERYDEWRRLKKGEALIAIGARSAVFAPVKNIGLIILDEEHENSYKQGEYPYYHAREVAIMRAKFCGATVILGSATPSLESYYWAKKGKFNYLALPKRIKQAELPPVKVIDMREELKKGNISMFSDMLQESIKESLKRCEQVLIFLNRRGYANFVLCRECGHVLRCKNCDISLTYHAELDHLCCHYCNYVAKVPSVCPECGSKYIKEFGVGTERVEKELKKIFPQAVIARMDMDTTVRKGSHQRILKRLEDGEIDILVGTQMIAKGHDYPNISTVGVITADNILNLPDFRSAERTFQLLTQVAGRTGRGDKKGRVIIQTYTPAHFSIQAAKEHNYQKFFNQEIKIRKLLAYPPFTQLVNIIVQGYQEKMVIEGAQGLDVFLRNYSKEILELLGPSPAPINRLRKRYRWQIIMKFKGWQKRNFVLSEVERKFLPKQDKVVDFNIDVDPIQML